MAMTMVNFRMEDELKRKMEETCKAMGMSVTTAYTIFAKAVTNQRRIPFEVTADPFYSAANLNYLRNVIADIENGRSKLEEHELIEE